MCVEDDLTAEDHELVRKIAALLAEWEESSLLHRDAAAKILKLVRRYDAERVASEIHEARHKG